MLVNFFQTSIVGNKLVQSVRDIVGKLTNHLVHLIEFLNGDILPDFNRKVVGIMDSVFLIIAVQPDTLRNIFLVDREREIQNFKPEEYWTLQVILNKTDGSKETFKASLNLGKDKTVKSKEEMDKIVEAITGEEFVATNVKKSVTKSQPSAPFTTSTLQQEALNRLGMSLKTTSSVAQALYEGVEIAGGRKTPLVTYIRTDSVRVAPEAQAKAKAFIEKNFGKKIEIL